MQKVSIVSPMWRSKENGDIPLCDRNVMTNEYLGRILKNAEHRFMTFNNQANNLCMEIEAIEKESVIAYKKSEFFRTKIKEIYTEAKRRGIVLESLVDTNPEKFDILRKDTIKAEVDALEL